MLTNILFCKTMKTNNEENKCYYKMCEEISKQKLFAIKARWGN